MPLPAVPARSRRRTAALAGALGIVGAALVATSVGLAAPATANPPGPHDPIGSLNSPTSVAHHAVRLQGWAADPDALTKNVLVFGVVDGAAVASVPTAVARPGVTAKYHTGPTPGFDLTVPVPATGTHTVCAAVRDRGVGIDRLLGCTATPLGTRLSSGQLAGHDPSGRLTGRGRTHSSMSVAGWVREPDYVARRTVVVLYVDGSPAATVNTSTASAAQVKAGSGPRGAFDITTPVGSGAHLGCVWAVNIGLGDNALLGCTSIDTRGHAGTGTVTEPGANKTALTVAKKQLGKPYVWGAEGPNTYDCSGLVMYSYRHAGVTTPRVAADQFRAARLIPASRAVAGDLVFYHDSEGHVYHVGMVMAPGKSVAAIDPQEGVAYQAITDSTATYGSFTHT